jgi:hypothetical protein
MAQIGELGANPTAFAGALSDGRAQISFDDVVRFMGYTRTVLPLDGFVFWVPTGITTDVKGSLHYTQNIQQVEDETQGLATVTFTSQEPVTLFSDAPIKLIYIATIDGFRFSFSQQQVYPQAGIWHYFGHSIQPAFASQLLDQTNGLKIDLSQAVTSNSLALWLALNNYRSPFYDGFSNVGVPFFQAPIQLYPSDMLPANLVPPYGSVRIGDDDTEALQPTPYLDANRNHYQLVADRVRITLYGVQNNLALDFQDTINQYSVETGNFGVMMATPFRDAIRTQAELQTRAMKKVMDIRVSYNQQRVAQVARQLILSCVPTYLIQSGAL